MASLSEEPKADHEIESFNRKETVEVLCVDATDTSLTLAWNSIDTEVLKWELEWRPTISTSSQEEDNQAAEWEKLGSKGFKTNMPPKQKSGLSPNTSFDFRVRGRDSVDWYDWGPVRTYSTLKEGTKRLPPVILKESEEGALTVAWEACTATITRVSEKEDSKNIDTNEQSPSSNNTDDDTPAPETVVMTYELQIRDTTSPSWTSISNTLSGTVAKKKNLDKFASYHFRVKPNHPDYTFSLSNNIGFKPVSALAPLFRELFGTSLIKGDGSTLSVDKLAGCVVAIYFSASWCGPCRQFTPQLAQLYEACRNAGRKFEVVFVSADRDEPSMKEYLTHMPWCAVPFNALERQQTQQKFQVNGIPNLKVFSPSGRLVDDNAVQSGNLTMPSLANWEKL